MSSIISRYIALQKKEYNIFWLVAIYIVCPTVLTSIVYALFCTNISNLFKSSGSDIITMLSIINGFLLSSISIVIANTAIDRKEADSRGIEFDKIKRMREIMMYDILFQILFIIPLCLLIIFLKTQGANIYIEYGTVYLGFISISIMCVLAYRFISYQGYIEKK